MPEDSERWQSIRDRIGDDHHASIVERQVNLLDRTVIDQIYRGNGSQPYDPIPLLKSVLYQYLKGNHSPATWHEEAMFNEPTMWLARGYAPSRRTWYDFRDRMEKFIESLHRQIIERALKEEHLDPTIGVQDGTTIAACASRHRMVNRATLDERIRMLKAISLGQSEGDNPRWVPPSESGRVDLAVRMKQASETLDKRIAKNDRRERSKRQETDKILVSISDPEAPPGRDKLKVFRPLYTVQWVVAPNSNLIMAYSCDAQATDAGTLAPMIDRVQELVDNQMQIVMADSAYCSIVDLQECRKRGIELLAPVQANSFTEAKKAAKPNQQISRDKFEWVEEKQTYRCPQGFDLNYIDRTRKQRHSGHTIWEYRYRASVENCQTCPLKSQCLRPGNSKRTIKKLEDQELLDNQRKKMADPQVQARYRIRGQVIERSFGDTKGNRRHFRFHGRGLSRASTETGLLVLSQNLQLLDRLERKHRKSVEMPT